RTGARSQRRSPSLRPSRAAPCRRTDARWAELISVHVMRHKTTPVTDAFFRSRRGTNRSMRGVVEAHVPAHGLRLFVRERGKGHPLLLINGLGSHAEMWGRAEEVLARGSRTIVFDSPGTGRSDLPLLPLSIPALARGARDVL